MNLSTRLAGDFDAAVKKRGQSYYWQGLVRIRRGSDSEVEAQVRGSRRYDVDLDWADGSLSAWCDCPAFDSNGPCKHIWATILAADAHGYLSAAAAATDLTRLYDGYDPTEDLDDEEPLPRPALVPKPPPPPAWRKQIQEITQHRAEVVRSSETWPAKRQLI